MRLHGDHVLDPTGKGQARWTMRWRTALNAFDITFDGPLSAARQYLSPAQLHRSFTPQGLQQVFRTAGASASPPILRRAATAAGRTCTSGHSGAACGAWANSGQFAERRIRKPGKARYGDQVARAVAGRRRTDAALHYQGPGGQAEPLDAEDRGAAHPDLGTFHDPELLVEGRVAGHGDLVFPAPAVVHVEGAFLEDATGLMFEQALRNHYMAHYHGHMRAKPQRISATIVRCRHWVLCHQHFTRVVEPAPRERRSMAAHGSYHLNSPVEVARTLSGLVDFINHTPDASWSSSTGWSPR